jgi:hypothetical protein
MPSRDPEFAGKRRLFADRRFKREFTPENVVGVYMPYMVVDANASADVAGTARSRPRSYTRGSGDNKKTYYDADVYAVERHVDFTVDDLTLEASSERGRWTLRVNTNNIINTILPFDTENAVKWNASTTSAASPRRSATRRGPDHPGTREPAAVDRPVPGGAQRRALRPRCALGMGGPPGARHRWVAMYLPVWLYSYYHEKGGNSHGALHRRQRRTGEVMGSVPVSQARLLAAALTTGTVIEGIVIAILGATR